MRIGDVLAVATGAAIGGGLRYALGGLIAERWGTSFPWHTLIINVSGAFFLGVLMAISVDRALVSSSWRLFIGVGILGGYTTFSTLAYESMSLFERGLTLAGAANLIGSGLAGLAAVLLGLWVGRVV
jgi:CrcB protein